MTGRDLEKILHDLPEAKKDFQIKIGGNDAYDRLVMFRPELVKFMVFCEEKLRENDNKSHWSGETMEHLHHRLYDEFGELKRAIKAKKPVIDIFRECADIANFAMMIADNYDPDIEDET